jgi:DNA-binding winged helix-turn-helix (wHTH) protein/Flp pilus assembly protein TadD
MQRMSEPGGALAELARGAVSFGAFRLEGGVLFRDRDPVRLTPKEAALLECLVQAEGAVVKLDDLIDKVWAEQVVGIESLNRCISTLRAKLGGAPQSIVATHHRRGYRLIPPLQRGPTATEPKLTDVIEKSRDLRGLRTRAGLESAIVSLRDLADQDPADPRPWVMVADLEVARALYRHHPPRMVAARGLAATQAALARCSDHAGALGARGWFHAVIDGRGEALSDLDRAAANDPENWTVRFYRGWSLATLGRSAEGVDELRKAVAIRPSAPELPAALGHLLFCAGQAEEARRILEVAVESTPYDDLSLAMLASAESWFGRHQRALDLAREAVAWGDGAPTACVALAYVLARAGQMAEARAELTVLRGGPGLRAPPSLLATALLEIEGANAARAALVEAEAEGCPYRGLAHTDPRLAGVS